VLVEYARKLETRRRRDIARKQYKVGLRCKRDFQTIFWSDGTTHFDRTSKPSQQTSSALSCPGRFGLGGALTRQLVLILLSVGVSFQVYAELRM